MIYYPGSVISQYLHVIMVVSLVIVTWSKAHFEISHPQIKCRSVSTEDWDLPYWTIHAGEKGQNSKSKSLTLLKVLNNPLILLNRWCPDAEDALLVRSLNFLVKGTPVLAKAYPILPSAKALQDLWVPGTRKARDSPGWVMPGSGSQDYKPTGIFYTLIIIDVLPASQKKKFCQSWMKKNVR